MDGSSSKSRKKLGAILSLASDWLLDVLRVWAEELNRAFAAAHYYGALTIARRSDLRDRASRARQVFDHIYAGT